MKELLLRIVSSLLAILGYDRKNEEPAREDDQIEQFEHLWQDTGGEG